MARQARVTQKIFASSASNNGVFGSGQAGTKLTTTSLSTIMSLPAWAQGWLDAIMGSSKFPPLEEIQALTYVQTSQLFYLLQQGIPEYDSGTEYYVNNIVIQAGTFKLYGSLTNANIGHAVTDAANWQFLGDLANLSNPASFYSGGTSTGSANAQIVSPLTPSGFNLTINGATVAFTAGFTNTTTTTLNAGSTGAKTIKKLSGASLVNLTAGDITLNDNIFVSFNVPQDCYVLFDSAPLGNVAALNVGTGLDSDGINLNLATIAANTVFANATAGSAIATGIAVALSQLFGRGASGNLAPISLGYGLQMTGTTLSAGLGTLWVREEETSGTNGQTLTINTWVKRTLNTVKVNTISGATITSSVISLPAGTYNIAAYGPSSPTSGADGKARLQNTTDATTIALGTNIYGSYSGGGNGTLNSIINGQFTLAGTKNIEFQQYSLLGSVGGNAVGIPSISEVYSEVRIERIA